MQWFQGVYIDRSNFFPNFASEPEEIARIFREEMAAYSEADYRDFVQDRNGCIVGAALAEKYGWRLGTVIPLKSDIFPITVRLNVRCIFRGSKPSDEQQLHFHYKLLEEGVPFFKGQVGDFWVRARRPEDVPGLIERIDRHFADAPEPTFSETENAFQLEFLRMMGDYATMIHAITGAVLLAILVVTANTMALAIRERGTEIAVFRAMGFTGLGVLGLLVAEGILLTVLGASLGLGLAFAAAGAIRQAAGTFLPYLQDFTIGQGTLLLCAHAAMITGLVSTLIPAYQAIRRPIVEGLRAL
jgi:putative ABC transport system permease protein